MDSRSLDLARLIECVAISDALDGVLLVGASASTVEVVAARLEALLVAAGAKAVDHVRLGSAETEDSLWGVPGLPAQWGGAGLLMAPDRTTRVVIVPELERVSRAAARAAVTILGNREIRIERRGKSVVKPLRQRWVAAIAETELGKVSPHLLERFPIRIRVREQLNEDRVATLKARIADGGGVLVDQESARRVQAAGTQVPYVEGALETAQTVTASVDAAGSMRPAIALLNVAQAWSRLERASGVSDGEIGHAARALGIISATAAEKLASAGTTPRQKIAKKDDKKPIAKLPEDDALDEEQKVDRELDGPVAQPDAEEEEIVEYRKGQVIAPDQPVISAITAPDTQVTPDPSAPRTEYTTLRIPWRQTKVTSSGRGTIIGTRRTESVNDLAIFDTLFAALPFQEYRRAKLGRESRRLIVLRSDLRAYRRTPPTEELLVLVLDYTSVQKRRWQRSLLPFLSDAYAARAELCIIKVGARDTPNEACAHRMTARSILVPSVNAAFREPAGRASPLADGLWQAHRVIQQTMGHGRGSTRKTTLVVVSDGRGNVPLEASRNGKLAQRVGMQGIEDAKGEARKISLLPNVRRFLVNPEPEWMKELPFTLASSLGASVVKMDKSNG